MSIELVPHRQRRKPPMAMTSCTKDQYPTRERETRTSLSQPKDALVALVACRYLTAPEEARHVGAKCGRGEIQNSKPLSNAHPISDPRFCARIHLQKGLACEQWTGM